MSLLGDPQQAYPVIHITGTNGKLDHPPDGVAVRRWGFGSAPTPAPTSNRSPNVSASVASRSVPTR